jgi:hypothetical protein
MTKKIFVERRPEEKDYAVRRPNLDAHRYEPTFAHLSGPIRCAAFREGA